MNASLFQPSDEPFRYDALRPSASKAFARVERVRKEMLMQRWIGSLKFVGYGVVVLMVLAIGYASFISIKYWSGISV